MYTFKNCFDAYKLKVPKYVKMCDTGINYVNKFVEFDETIQKIVESK